MKKILIAVILLFTFTGGYVVADSLNSSFEGNPIIKLFNGGKELAVGDIPAINYHNRTMVPIYLLNQLGIETVWNEGTQSVDIKLPEIVKIVHPALSQDKLNEIAKSVYEVFGSTDDPKIANQGSGFIIGDNIMVSNYHVGGASKIVQLQIDGLWYNVSQENYSFANKANDLMGFKVVGGKPLPYSTVIPHIGDEVWAIGYLAGKLTTTEGKVTGFDNSKGFTEIKNTAHTSGGESGGVLLNTDGEVIGITTSGVFGTDDNFSIPMQYVQDELNKLK